MSIYLTVTFEISRLFGGAGIEWMLKHPKALQQRQSVQKKKKEIPGEFFWHVLRQQPSGADLIRS